jgi:DNA-binding response OmpR family regulator
MLGKSQFDLIIMEYWLPLMKGNELAAFIKQEWPDQPIIMTAAHSEEINGDDHPLTGVDCLLNKPFSMQQLREAMIWVFDRYAGKRQREQETYQAHGSHLEDPDNPRSVPKDSNK